MGCGKGGEATLMERFWEYTLNEVLVGAVNAYGCVCEMDILAVTKLPIVL